MHKVHFVKYQGAGNDFIAIDNRGDNYVIAEADRKLMCDRHFGIGADGIVEIKLSQTDDFRVIYYNSDGREGSLCGNGCRCALAYVRRLGIKSSATSSTIGEDLCESQGDGPENAKQHVYTFEATDGSHAGILKESVKGDLVFHEYSVHFKNVLSTEIKQYNDNEFFLDTGSPHHVKFLTNGLDGFNVLKAGRELRFRLYGECGSNINFAHEPEAPKLESGEKHQGDTIHVRTYERGVEDETMACGTGAVAVAIVHFAKKSNTTRSLERLDNKQETTEADDTILKRVHKIVRMRGGALTVTFTAVIAEERSCVLFKDIYLTGPAERVFDGVYDLQKLN